MSCPAIGTDAGLAPIHIYEDPVNHRRTYSCDACDTLLVSFMYSDRQVDSTYAEHLDVALRLKEHLAAPQANEAMGL